MEGILNIKIKIKIPDWEDIMAFLFTWGYFIGAAPIIIGLIGAWYFRGNLKELL